MGSKPGESSQPYKGMKVNGVAAGAPEVENTVAA